MKYLGGRGDPPAIRDSRTVTVAVMHVSGASPDELLAAAGSNREALETIRVMEMVFPGGPRDELLELLDG